MNNYYGPGLDALANAIVIQALLDYQAYPRRKEALRKKRMSKRKRRLAKQRLENEYKDAAGFLESQWCFALCGKTKEEILQRVEGKNIKEICRGFDRAL